MLLPVGEQLVVLVVLAVVGIHLIENGARRVAYLLWPVLHVEPPGRRYEATMAQHPTMSVPQGVRIMRTPSSEHKLTCALAYPSIV